MKSKDVMPSTTVDPTNHFDNNTHSSVSFPTPWTSRIQTPVKRVPSDKLWDQPARYKNQTYGGPQ